MHVHAHTQSFIVMLEAKHVYVWEKTASRILTVLFASPYVTPSSVNLIIKGMFDAGNRRLFCFDSVLAERIYSIMQILPYSFSALTLLVWSSGL